MTITAKNVCHDIVFAKEPLGIVDESRGEDQSSKVARHQEPCVKVFIGFDVSLETGAMHLSCGGCTIAHGEETVLRLQFSTEDIEPWPNDAGQEF